MEVMNSGSWINVPRSFAAIVLALVVVLGMVPSAAAQVTAGSVPVIEEAESIFRQGVDAYEAGDYGMAYRRLRLVIDGHEFNRVTTAAEAMAIKALYRQGRYEHTVELADSFLRRYGTSRYVDEVRRVRGFASEQQREQERRLPTIQLGVVLPMTGANPVTQSLFNGIRIAVDAHNRTSGDVRPVRMIFRDSHNDPTTAREAVADLARENVDVIIGPIFSDEAKAAADEAERRGVTLITPLATDEDVAAGRRYVFQANPPLSARGRFMARQAMRDGLTRFGVAARLHDQVAEQMAEGFQDELLQRGIEVAFYELVESNAAWAEIEHLVGADTLAQVEAVYVALAGTNSTSQAQSLLRGLSEAGSQPMILGSDGWHDLPPRDELSRYQTTYATDFYVDSRSDGVRRFDDAFRDFAGVAPDRPAYTGYDVTTYVLSRRLDNPRADLHDILHHDISYQGLGTRIDFSNGNVNQALYVFGYRDGRLELLR